MGERLGLAEWQPENASERVISVSADACLAVGFPSNSGRAAFFLLNFDIYHSHLPV
jgi:hypothetical protein